MPPTCSSALFLFGGWTIRRPNSRHRPVLLLRLFADLMPMSRPVGLGALGLLLATEAARIESAGCSGPFLLKWLLVTLCFALVLTDRDPARLSFAAGRAGAALSGATTRSHPLVVAGLVSGCSASAPRARRASPTPAMSRDEPRATAHHPPRADAVRAAARGDRHVLAGRMRDLQIVQHDHYAPLSDETGSTAADPPARRLITRP